MVGEAFTLRYIPAREDIDTLEVYDDYDHPQRLAVEQAAPARFSSWTAAARDAPPPRATSC